MMTEMTPWVESLAAALLALLGAGLGRWFSRLRRPYWALGYSLPLLLIILYACAAHRPATWLVPPVSWMMLGRRKFAAIGFLAAMVLTAPLSRLARRRDRIAVLLLMAVIVLRMSVWPFLAPAFNRDYLAQLETHLDSNGVCRQSTDYNCGPAAAVTALRKLGLRAEEGQIAILSRTTPAAGTEPDVLAQALQDEYGRDGLAADFRTFRNLAELRDAGLTLAVVKFTFLVDHYVTVFEVTDSEVVVGDPLHGLGRLTHQEFIRQWRFSGVVLKRRS